jgi:hypothetical protein
MIFDHGTSWCADSNSSESRRLAYHLDLWIEGEPVVGVDGAQLAHDLDYVGHCARPSPEQVQVPGRSPAVRGPQPEERGALEHEALGVGRDAELELDSLLARELEQPRPHGCCDVRHRPHRAHPMASR